MIYSHPADYSCKVFQVLNTLLPHSLLQNQTLESFCVELIRVPRSLGCLRATVVKKVFGWKSQNMNVYLEFTKTEFSIQDESFSFSQC